MRTVSDQDVIGNSQRSIADRLRPTLPDTAQGKRQAFRRNWFYQIIQRIYLECTQSELIICGGKDHVRGFASNAFQQVESTLSRHLNVEKKQVRSQLVDLSQRLVGVLCLTNH